MTVRPLIATLAITCVLWGDGHTAHRKKQADCDHVKETCSRKKGCKCRLECDERGRRMPPQGGRDECPSYCCEDKCECHPMGCP